MFVLLSVLIAVLVIYFAATGNAKVAEVGRIMFGVGLFVALFYSDRVAKLL